MSQPTQVLFASRIPAGLKERLTRYCSAHGVKMNFFVSRAIQERLERQAEDKADVQLIRERQGDADYVGQKQMASYLKKRLSSR